MIADIYHIGNGFVYDFKFHQHFKADMHAEMSALVEKSEGSHEKLLRLLKDKPNVNSVTHANLVKFSDRIMNCLVPERLRHLLYKKGGQGLSDKAFTQKLFEAVRRE
jgi:hypothetical protein